jgi:general secretion pathway protein H
VTLGAAAGWNRPLRPAGELRWPDAAARPTGFSLLELIVVLAIIAAAIIAIPNIFAGLPGVRLRTAADGMVAVLRGLHEEAIRREQTTELVLDPATRSYRTSTVAQGQLLPAVVTDVGFTNADRAGNAAGADVAPHIRFYADGSASGGTIRLSHGTLSVSVGVDWLTGRVSRSD